MKNYNCIIILSIFLFFFSCASDCENVKIEKAEWITSYEDYYIDTLANYSVVRNYINFEESMSSKISEITNSYNRLYSSVNELYNKSRNTSNDESTLRNIRNSHSSNISFSGYNYLTYVIEIRNNSNFTTSFAIRDNNDLFSKTEYHVVRPYNTKEFVLRRTINWHNKKNTDFTSNLIILQKKQRVKKTRRIDELHISEIQINTCEKSIETEQAKYNAIKEQYLQKIDKEKQIIK